MNNQDSHSRRGINGEQVTARRIAGSVAGP
jgi:hypothetical protein